MMVKLNRPSQYHVYVFVVSLFCLFPGSFSDFVYPDFNETTGLTIIGDAGTTNCVDLPLQRYGDVQGKADLFNKKVIHEYGEATDLTSESFTETNIASFNEMMATTLAGFLHRPETASAPERCAVRTRLTPSNPSQIGAMWFIDEVPVLAGFETSFTFQVSDHSKVCTIHRDQYFSQFHHRTCSVRGGDGFAFVIHNDPDGIEAIGEDGGQMGFGSMPNSLAIAFDMWQNPGSDSLFSDHVSIQSRGRLPNDALEAGLIGLPRPHKMADGTVHLAKIQYFNDLRAEYLDYLVASDSLLPYLLDNGEQKRVGTLVVFLDDGVETDTPLLAMPINLSLLLDLPSDKAFVGFTGATGRFYEKQDILSWHWCDENPCKPVHKDKFDYHQQSKYSSVSTRNVKPGPGFGGGDTTEGFPIKHHSPITTAWSNPVEHFSEDRRNEGLAPEAYLQVPDATLY